MDEQKDIKSFKIVCDHLEKIDKENESIRKELAEAIEKLNELQTCFDKEWERSVHPGK